MNGGAPAEWRLRRPAEGAEAALRRDARFPAPLAGVLAARGFSGPGEARAFLDPASDHDPLLLDGMDAAVGRLVLAWRRREKVAVFGDYDVDGVTGTALLCKLLALLGLPHEAYLPDRAREGYGPNVPALKALRERGAAVVVTVDCGTSALAEALAARELGLDFIVTDHHVPGPELPAALALINPRLSARYPYPSLAGVAVAYKLAEAVLKALEHPRTVEFLDHMLELVALGTVCDVAPLDGENRVLAREGLERLRRGRWMGLRHLAEAGDFGWKDADSGTLGFQYGPRINAGGRVGDAGLGLRLLLEKDASASRALAARLDGLNRERRELERAALDQALARAEERLAREPGARSLVLWDRGWHSGVVGLVAARLLERFLLPVFVFADEGGTAKGSGRSRGPLNLAACLRPCAPHLLKFGGHEAAAGATARVADLPAFAEAFDAAVRAASDAPPARVLDLDLELTLGQVEPSWLAALGALEPHGRRNPRPLFLARGLRLGPGSRAVGAEGKHLQLSLAQGGSSLPGIAFGFGPRLKELSQAPALEAAFHLERDAWRGGGTPRLDVRDLRPAGAESAAEGKG